MAKKIRVKPDYPAMLAAELEWCGLPKPVMEHRFAPPRRYRFDLAWPQESVKLAVEVDGGTWIPGGGRHNRPQGFENDIRKLNLGVMLGWRILRYTPAMIESGEARAELEKILGE